MLDIKKLRNNSDKILKSLAKKDKNISLDSILKLDDSLKALTTKLNELQADQNSKSKEVGILKSKGESADDIFSDLKILSDKIKELEKEQRELSLSLKDALLEIPNLPHSSCPQGFSDKDNVVVIEKKTNKEHNFNVKNHIEIGKQLDILDFEVAAKMSGSGFPLYKGKGALLERALINFMIDYHLKNFNYTEFFTPFLVKPDSALTTGQLPKFSEDMYHIEKDDLFLIPTAEVSLTNIHKDDILSLDNLPKYYLGYSACFRREAGSYGSHVRGLNRLHQFDKVEIVRIESPEKSYIALEEMVRHVKSILSELNLPFRIVRLCGGDLGFTSCLTYDFEVYSAAQKKWLEVSSVSNFETFQSNRLKLRINNNGEKVLAHTLNGSSLALPRVVACILENFQTEKSINIPKVLIPYTGFDKI